MCKLKDAGKEQEDSGEVHLTVRREQAVERHGHVVCDEISKELIARVWRCEGMSGHRPKRIMQPIGQPDLAQRVLYQHVHWDWLAL